IRIQPTVWMFTPFVVACTAKVRIAPTAIRKMPTPRPIYESSFIDSGGRRYNGQGALPGAGAQEFPVGSAPPNASGCPSASCRSRDPRRRRRMRTRTRAHLAAALRVAGGRPDRLRLLVHGRDLHLRLLARSVRYDVRAPQLQ